jgi:hypothetical protein
MSLAPVGIFVFNRPQHTYNLLESITNCSSIKNIRFYVFSEFYNKPEDKQKVLEVRFIVNSFKNKLNILLIKYRKNKGLYKSIIYGVNYIIKRNSKVIVLEDDLILDNSFFKYMNLSLTKYKNKKKVMQISGYSYPIKNNGNSAYFLNLSSCWGWGIHKRNWLNFIDFISNKKNIILPYQDLLNSNKLKNDFNCNGNFNYFRILKKHITSKVSSWGILFYLYCFYKKKLILYPSQSLVNNLGFDGSGHHRSFSNFFNYKKKIKVNSTIVYPVNIEINKKLLFKVYFFFRKNLSYFSKIKSLFL